MENYRKTVHRLKKNNLTVLVNDTLWFNDHLGAHLSTRGPHALTGAQVCRYSSPTSRFPL